MSVPTGTKLGVFEISTLLGVGGMGEVYRARDTKLGRDVAIKILPQEFAGDRNRLARFQREARLLAALNHPNIAHIHDIQESDGVQFLVMELVGGTTLTDRLKKGPLPLDEALELFTQIAEGLDAAHQQGIIHRDLKPANIKITDDGRVSLLDFGLAKAMEPASSTDRAAVTSPWNAQSDGKSREGQILGTPAYMSPEQARGKPVDKRTDIWAFGCCLYEALSGERPFHGETGSDTLAAILKVEPDWKRLPSNIPGRLRELLQSCLTKEPRDRLHDIADVRLELRRIADNPEPPATNDRPHANRSRLVAIAVPGVIAGSIAGASLWNLVRQNWPSDQTAPSNRSVIRTTIELAEDSPIRITSSESFRDVARFALSNDGSRLVYAGVRGGETKLYSRPLDRLEATPLPSTQDARDPFFSPDGLWIGFFADGKLKKLSVRGGQPLVLCDARNPRGATWGRDGTIYFAESLGSLAPLNRGLKRVHESGGAPQWLTRNEGDPNIIGHIFPFVLPDGKSLLFALASYSNAYSSIAALSIETGKWKIVLREASQPRYVSTGHLLFNWPLGNPVYYAARFDLDQLAVVGARIPVLETDLSPCLSDAGCLVHSPYALRTRPVPLVWVNLKGEAEPLKLPPRSYFSSRVSPDGNRLALSILDDRGYEIWFYDLQRETLSRLNFDGSNRLAAWTPDGRRVVFSSDHGGKAFNLFVAPIDGSAEPRRLTQCDSNQFVSSITPDGKTLAITQMEPLTGADICTMQLDGSGPATPLIQTEFFEAGPVFSPDGRWLAYASDESGRQEVFVRSYPDLTGKWQISNHGGGSPRWSSKGDKLFYRQDAGLYAVSIETESGFTPGRAQLLFESPIMAASYPLSYDISPDGQRFITPGLADVNSGAIHQLVVVQNWFEELKRLVPDAVAAEKPAR